MNLETKIIIYKFTPQVFTLTQKIHKKHFMSYGFSICITANSILGNDYSPSFNIN